MKLFGTTGKDKKNKVVYVRVSKMGKAKIINIPKDADIEVGDYVRVEVAK